MTAKRITKPVYVVTGNTESSDELTPLLFDGNPTNKQINDIYKEMYPIEYEEIGCVHFSVTRVGG